MKNLLKLKELLLAICILFWSQDAFPQQNILKQGAPLTFKFGVFNVVKIESASVSPVNKVSAKNGNHFILISLKALKIEKDKEFSSVFFVLTDKSNKKYTEPGAWGKIEVMGSISNFEATDGATVYARHTDDILNLIFEVPNNIWPNQVTLIYEGANIKK